MNMIRYGFLGALLVVTTASTALAAQAFYLEFGGPAGQYSLNYEKSVYRAGATFLQLRFGASVSPAPVIDIPAGLTVLLGKKHHLELGMGLEPEIYAGTPAAAYNLLSYGVVGYRYQRDTGFLFRAGLTPILQFKPTWGMVWVHLGAGWAL